MFFGGWRATSLACRARGCYEAGGFGAHGREIRTTKTYCKPQALGASPRSPEKEGSWESR